jgi:UDP-GlcNAc3NAcA epimerase
MKKILTVIGARPQIIKAAALSRAIRNHFADQLKEVILHTGQHYDENMSEVFFTELNIPAPDYNLNVGSESHGKQTALMLEGIEKALLAEKPNAIVLYGDTNSTLAGAIAAVKLGIPVVHIEAGLRSFNKSMPEEINRIMCDHSSTLLFTPTESGIINLTNEGFALDNDPPYSADHPKIFHCGDVMYDNSLYFAGLAEVKSAVYRNAGAKAGEFILVTVHRNHNTDDPGRFTAILRALTIIANEKKESLVFPIHPRARKYLDFLPDEKVKEEFLTHPSIHLIPPVSFLEMIALEKNAKMVLTDSGGVQKEAFYFKKPCVIIRPETEWVELLEMGVAMLADADEKKIISGVHRFRDMEWKNKPEVYGDGHAAEFICSKIIELIP